MASANKAFHRLTIPLNQKIGAAIHIEEEREQGKGWMAKC